MSTGSERAKVLLLLPSLGGGGAERVMVTLATRLDRLRFEPAVVVLEKKGPHLDSLPADVPVHDLNSRRVRYAIPSLVRLIWKLRPAVVLSNISHLNLMLIGSKPLWPPGVRLWVRETVVVRAWMAAEVENARLLGALYRRLYRRADGIVCQCDAMATDLANGFGVPARKMVRIYNPVEIDRIRDLASSAPNPFSDNGPHVVACGRLIPMKGFDLLIEAMAEVVRALPETDLTILGEGPCQADLRAQADRLGLAEKVHFLGYQTNPYPWIKWGDLFVLSSRYEGLPNVMLEALALGTRVVGMDCPGGVREILDTCPIGRVTPAGDVLKLAQAIVTSLEPESGSTTAEGLDRFLDRFRVERVVNEYEQLFSPAASISGLSRE